MNRMDLARDVESQLVAAWTEALGLDEIGPNDQFVELGGNSLLAAMIVEICLSDYGIAFDVLDLFEYGTPRALAVAVYERKAAQSHL